jgi:hypothetical protein
MTIPLGTVRPDKLGVPNDPNLLTAAIRINIGASVQIVNAEVLDPNRKVLLL